ncbi:hypothetical protein NP493_132g01003 [Ridgeia piscesae]|uniref:Uncharacterized protein n=1 Tax=Ridgeia piscesae TaxID=27915 RepID=A0AAD9UGB5_RIDPI|nr:hypothetical protein NP493_132g01003 [Ridgeia piscesae]
MKSPRGRYSQIRTSSQHTSCSHVLASCVHSRSHLRPCSGHVDYTDSVYPRDTGRHSAVLCTHRRNYTDHWLTLCQNDIRHNTEYRDEDLHRCHTLPVLATQRENWCTCRHRQSQEQPCEQLICHRY